MATSEEVASFAVELDDRISPAARSAAHALVELKEKLDQDTKALREMQAMLNRLKAGGLGGSDTAKQLAAAITAQKAALAHASAGYLAMGGAVGQATTKQASFLDMARMTPGMVGQLAGRLSILRTLLQSSAGRFLIAASAGLFFAGALVAGAIAAAAAASALAVAAAALVRYGLAAADAHRNELLHLEGLVAVRRMHGRTSASAVELEGAIARVSARSGLGRSAITGYAESLNRMGLRGANLNAALEGMAISAAVGGEEAGRRFAAMAAGAARTGRSVTALADRVRTTLGPIARRMAVSLESQWTRMREGIASIFTGPRVSGALERFLSALDRLTSQFSEFSGSGRALRAIVEAIFPSLLDGAAGAGPAIRRFFDRMLIAALDVTIAFVRIRNSIRALGRTEVLPDSLRGALVLATPLLFGVAAAVFVVREAFSYLGRQIMVGVAFWTLFFAAVGRVYSFFTETDWRALGESVPNGIVLGIASGLNRVRGAVSDLATSARRALTDALGIHSPSRVFAEYGVNVSRGMAEGVREGAPEASRAVGEMVSVPGGAPGRSGGTSIGPIEIHVHTSSSDGRGIAEDIRAELARALEEIGVELGGAPA